MAGNEDGARIESVGNCAQRVTHLRFITTGQVGAPDAVLEENIRTHRPGNRFVRRVEGLVVDADIQRALTQEDRGTLRVSGGRDHAQPHTRGHLEGIGGRLAQVGGTSSGLDELTTTDANQVWIVSGGTVTPTEFDARESLGMASASIEDLAGGEASENAAVARDVLSGGGADAVRDAVALNVGAGILAWEGLENPVMEVDFEQRMRGAVERALVALADGVGARLVERWVAASNA